MRVLGLFDRRLPEAWEIYVQPHLNGLRPDFVLLNPAVGIAVFEVKDWNLEAMEYYAEPSYGSLILKARKNQGHPFVVKDNPVVKVDQYRKAILELYCPRLELRMSDEPRIASVVTAGVIMTAASTRAAEELLQPFRNQLKHLTSARARYYPVAGRDALDNDAIGAVFPESQRTASRLMSADLALDLRSWLIEPSYADIQRQPVRLDKQQRALLARPLGKTGQRRVRGSAGSGKSLVLAAKAAELSAEGRDVLVITFNITLWHYLRDLAVRYPVREKRLKDKVTWCHFHDWCKRVCFDAGMGTEYDDMWRRYFQGRVGDLDSVLDTILPALTERAIIEGPVDTYDAVLVDEGQDFNPHWWNLLTRVRRDGGEMMLVADATQDLYGRATRWTEERMQGAGFVGQWSKLEASYRTPPELIPYLRTFIKSYLPSLDTNLPTAAQQPSLFGKLEWVQIAPRLDPAEVAAILVESVLRFPTFADPVPVAFTDTTLLVQSNRLGLMCVTLLEEAGISVAHTFGEDDFKRRRRKRGFFMGDGRVKATTIHSFKGWETRALVVHINQAADARSLAAVYAGLSRLKHHDQGSFLTVVCSDPTLEDFGRSWPTYRFPPASEGIRPAV